MPENDIYNNKKSYENLMEKIGKLVSETEKELKEYKRQEMDGRKK